MRRLALASTVLFSCNSGTAAPAAEATAVASGGGAASAPSTPPPADDAGNTSVVDGTAGAPPSGEEPSKGPCEPIYLAADTSVKYQVDSPDPRTTLDLAIDLQTDRLRGTDVLNEDGRSRGYPADRPIAEWEVDVMLVALRAACGSRIEFAEQAKKEGVTDRLLFDGPEGPHYAIPEGGIGAPAGARVQRMDPKAFKTLIEALPRVRPGRPPPPVVPGFEDAPEGFVPPAVGRVRERFLGAKGTAYTYKVVVEVDPTHPMIVSDLDPQGIRGDAGDAGVRNYEAIVAESGILVSSMGRRGFSYDLPGGLVVISRSDDDFHKDDPNAYTISVGPAGG